ncbi:glycosyltransferase [Sinomonas sp. ASV322]|uniref:glycosyltransferase n=1 Tax=Sinomonas sp. ASV322 TaxID=3041920 RepID=UPI0027DE7CDB|nr:glycosyltransferase [Sinomonas sp. ASV322]MDQ4503895.1 glycosyltransferase [Sinomonas sp. ASV322]
MRLDFVVPAPLAWRSGGTVYDERLAAALAAAGADVRITSAEGAWPVGSSADRARLGALIREIADDGGGRLIVDGLVGLGCPGEIAGARRAGLDVWLLVQMLISEWPGGERPGAKWPGAEWPGGERPSGEILAAPGRHAALESAALAAASGAITPSSTTASEVLRRYGVVAAVARPGVDRAPIAHGSEPPRIVCFAALMPSKRQLALLDALRGLADLPWTAELVGSDRADPEYARAVREAASAPPLRGRVRIAGELRGEAFEAAWDAADLSVLASASETFGLVVVESLARGVPAIVPAGTGAEEALGLSRRGGAGLAGAGLAEAGLAEAGLAGAGLAGAGLAGAACRFAGDVGAASDAVTVLRSWLTNPVLRSQWLAIARAARPVLPGWNATARAVLAAVGPS